MNEQLLYIFTDCIDTFLNCRVTNWNFTDLRVTINEKLITITGIININYQFDDNDWEIIIKKIYNHQIYVQKYNDYLVDLKIKQRGCFYPKHYAYCTLLSSDNYLIGVKMLSLSLQRVHTYYDFIVIATDNLSQETFNELDKENIKYIKVPLIQQKNPKFERWNLVGNKFYMFGLTQYQKIMFLDADVLVLRNMDSWFYYQECYADMSINQEIVGEFFIIKPNIDLQNVLITDWLNNPNCLETTIMSKYLTFNSVNTEVYSQYFWHDYNFKKYWVIFQQFTNDLPLLLKLLLYTKFTYWGD